MLKINFYQLLLHSNLFIVAFLEAKVSLVNSRASENNTGTIEVYHPGFGWGTICGQDWDETESEVACRRLGSTGANAARWWGGFFDEGIAALSLHVYGCNGTES